MTGAYLKNEEQYLYIQKNNGLLEKQTPKV